MKNIPLFQEAPEHLQRYTFKLEEMEGIEIPETLPVDLSVDPLTPITRQPIDQINKMTWAGLPAPMLQDQLEALRARYQTALGLGRPEMALQMQAGIKELEKNIDLRMKIEAENRKARPLPGEDNVTESTNPINRIARKP